MTRYNDQTGKWEITFDSGLLATLRNQPGTAQAGIPTLVAIHEMAHVEFRTALVSAVGGIARYREKLEKDVDLFVLEELAAASEGLFALGAKFYRNEEELIEVAADDAAGNQILGNSKPLRLAAIAKVLTDAGISTGLAGPIPGPTGIDLPGGTTLASIRNARNARVAIKSGVQLARENTCNDAQIKAVQPDPPRNDRGDVEDPPDFRSDLDHLLALNEVIVCDFDCPRGVVIISELSMEDPLNYVPPSEPNPGEYPPDYPDPGSVDPGSVDPGSDPGSDSGPGSGGSDPGSGSSNPGYPSSGGGYPSSSGG